MSPLDDSVLDFIKSYNFKVVSKQSKVVIIDKDHTNTWVNIIMIIIGLAGIPIAYLGSYEIGIIFLLLLAFPIIRIVNKKPKKVIFDFLNQRVQNISLADMVKFKFIKTEALAYATAFEEGVTDYTLTLIVINKNNVSTELMSFIDRHENKPGAKQLLDSMNSWLMS